MKMSVIPGALVGYMGTFVAGLFTMPPFIVDGHFTSGSGKLIADAQIITSERSEEQGYGGVFDLMYNVAPNLSHKFEIDYMDENINFNDLGSCAGMIMDPSDTCCYTTNKELVLGWQFPYDADSVPEYNTTKSRVTDSAFCGEPRWFCQVETR